MTEVLNALTVDVEDWFHILDVAGGPRQKDWGTLESRVGLGLRRLLDLLDETDTRGAFLVLGWIAERHPELVAEIIARGHELGTHGYGHELIFSQSATAFREDLQKGIAALRAIAPDVPIRAYRAPGFSLVAQTLWATRVLAEADIGIDTSIFPAVRGHGGIPGFEARPFRFRWPDGRELQEFPISVAQVLGRGLAYCGGGYLRLFPLSLIRRWIQAANREGRPVVVYVHPRELDPAHPRVKMNPYRTFKAYVNLEQTAPKLRALLKGFRFGRISDSLARLAPLPERPGPADPEPEQNAKPPGDAP